MILIMNQLHFLQPLWLLALIPLGILWWVIVRSTIKNSKAWEKVIDPKLLPLLLNGSDEKHSRSESLAKWLIALVWLLATIALADPVWEKIPRPIFQTNSARVIVLDLSNSMQIDDLKPSRLARARFKIEDILSESFTKNEEGQVGLVLFAGDAFTASPLTRDTETIRALLQVLTPDLMPSQGSRVDLGLIKAHELLTQAGITKGQVLLISDGVEDQDAALKASKKLKDDGHTLSVLAVGTETGGKLPQLKYRNGDSIVVALDSEFLQEIATTGGGKFHLISTTDSDLRSVLTASSSSDINKPDNGANNDANKNTDKNTEKNDDLNSEEWKSSGPFIILLLLPLAALAFRRGWLFSVLIIGSLLGLIHPQPVLASPMTKSLSNSWDNTWSNLWINKEQQAEKALKEQQYDRASSLSKKPSVRGSAHYKNKDYENALKEFEQAKGADARYNEGNTLAELKKYQEAIKAYDEALKLQPNMADAKKNKTAIETLLKKKKEQKSDDDNNNKQKGDGKNKKDDTSKKDKQNSDDKNEDGKTGEQGEQGEKKENEDGKKGKQSNDENKKDDKNQFSEANKDLDNQKDKDQQKNNNGDDNDDKKTDEQPTKDDSKSKKPSNETPKREADNKKDDKSEGTNASAKELSKEEKMAAEQWLRRIPDDPGGLLRRKFEAQYKQRRRSINDTKQPW